MTLIAFDSKQFRRGKTVPAQEEETQGDKYLGFGTQLGIGVSTDDPSGFVQSYVKANRELKASFEIIDDMPFFSSTYLKNTLGMPKAISFTDRLITSMQEHISSVHCSFVVLPPSQIPTIQVGGFRNRVDRPTRLFINDLGPMFSYLTAHSYLWMRDYQDLRDLEIHIDSFRSKSTKAWHKITDSTTPKIFMRGDECDPFISCADIMAFLTDAKLYSQRLRLEPDHLKQVWNEYSFKVTTQFFDRKSLPYYAWKTNDPIDFSAYVARPVIFLAIDNIELEAYAVEEYEEGKEMVQDTPPKKPRRFNRVIKNSPVYYVALSYALQKKGCLKLFSQAEDMSLVRDGDVYVYVGENSQSIGRALQHGYDIEVLSGLEARKLIEK